jgi:hypothetical protein
MAGCKKWSRAVWKEGDQEEELVIPSSWIEGKFIRWPNSSSAAAALKEMRKPEKTWLKFNLIKVKFSSGMLCRNPLTGIQCKKKTFKFKCMFLENL